MSTPRPKLAGDIYSAIRILLVLGILAYLAQRIHGERVLLTAVTFNWNFSAFAGAFICTVLAYQLLLFAWLLLLQRAGLYRPGRAAAYARVWWQSYIYRYVPGKVLLAVERARLGNRLGIPYAVGAAFPVIETLLAILAGSVVSLLAVSWYAAGTRELLAGLAILVTGITLLMPFCFRWAMQSRMLRHRCPQLESIRLRSSDILIAVLPYVLHYLLLGFSFFLIARMAYPLAWAELPGLCGIYALSHVVSLLVVLAPGGLGVREGALAVQLTKTMPASIAGVVAIAARLWFTLVELICWLFVLCSCRGRASVDAEPQMPQGPGTSGGQ